MTAEWLHLPPPYPPGVGPLYGAELEAWYEDLQDILGSDTGGAKLARAPTCTEVSSLKNEMVSYPWWMWVFVHCTFFSVFFYFNFCENFHSCARRRLIYLHFLLSTGFDIYILCFQKEPEFMDVLESCSLTWLTDGSQTWGDGVQRTTEEIHSTQTLHHNSSSSSSSSSSCMSPAVTEERQVEAEGGRSGDGSAGGGSDLLPPEFFELLSDGGVGMVDASGAVISGGYYYHHQHHQANVHPASPSASEEELPCVPDSPSCSSSASQSPSQICSSPSSPVSSPSVYSSSRLGKRKRTTSERANGALSSFVSSSQRSSYSSTKKSRKEREQENERKVQELTEQNERLKAEIERLGEEVQRTRRALIERLVNTRKWEGGGEGRRE